MDSKLKMGACRNICSLFVLFLIACTVQQSSCRIHTLKLKDDGRQYITMSTFGFYNNGSLEVNLQSLSVDPFDSSKMFGFSLEKTITDATSPYLQNHQDRCMLEARDLQDDKTMAVITFTLDLKSKSLVVNCTRHLQHIQIYTSNTTYWNDRWAQRASRDAKSDLYLLPAKHIRRRRETGDGQSSKVSASSTAAVSAVSPSAAPQSPSSAIVETPAVSAIDTKPVANSSGASQTTSQQQPAENKPTPLGNCNGIRIPVVEKKNADGLREFSVTFIVAITREDEEGLYNLNFHNCPNYPYNDGTPTNVNLTVRITENNDGNYLSAGEMPLPALYFTMSVLFFLSGCFWIFILRKSNHIDVYKIHYVMGVLVYLKSFNLMFHGVHYHFIQTYGIHVESWAILDYVTHLLKGALMFTTIVLIGTGWAFIKHVLSDKDKKIFMIVIPLQVLDNVAEIIMSESQEGDLAYFTWRDVFILVDLLCCGAILFPVIWSIRHLQDASQTDGKAAVNLRKLKLFRHFYIMIVCYIYFSRIIVHLLKITVPFKYEWLDEMFYEMAAFVFYVMTGYKFRPASNNPYFQLSQDEPDLEFDQIITQTGLTEGLKKVNQRAKDQEPLLEGSSNRRESSLEYD